MTITTLRVRPINDTIGAHVEGVDLGASLDDDIIRALRRALLDHLVLFFRDQDITPEKQLAFTERFAILNDLPSAVYISRTAGDGKFFEVVPGEPINGGPYGIGFNKQNRPLAEAVQKALQQLIADGTYGKILQAWGVEQGAVKEAAINGGS